MNEPNQLKRSGRPNSTDKFQEVQKAFQQKIQSSFAEPSLNKLKPYRLFLGLMLLFGVVATFLMPIFSVPDEATHFAHAYFIFHVPNSQLDYSALKDLAGKAIDNTTYSNGTFFKLYFQTKIPFQTINPSTVAINFSDLKWLPQAIGMKIGETIFPSYGVMVLFGRWANLLFYTIGVYFSIRLAKFGQLPMVAVALLPISVQQAASLSYDVPFFVAVFWTFSLMTNLWTRKEKLSPLWLLYMLLPMIYLFAVKPSALLLGLYFLTLPTVLFGQGVLSHLLNQLWTYCNAHKRLVVGVSLVIFLIFLQISFIHQGGLFNGLQILVNTFFRSDVNGGLDSTLTSGVIGNFGYFLYRLPEWFVIFDFIFLALIMLNEDRIELEWRIVVSSAVIFVLNVLVIGVTMYLSWTLTSLNMKNAAYSLGSQGRYYTPFLLVFIPIAMGAHFRKYIRVTIPPLAMYRWTWTFLILNASFFFVLTLLYYYVPDHGIYLLSNFLKL